MCRRPMKRGPRPEENETAAPVAKRESPRTYSIWESSVEFIRELGYHPDGIATTEEALHPSKKEVTSLRSKSHAPGKLELETAVARIFIKLQDDECAAASDIQVMQKCLLDILREGSFLFQVKRVDFAQAKSFIFARDLEKGFSESPPTFQGLPEMRSSIKCSSQQHPVQSNKEKQQLQKGVTGRLQQNINHADVAAEDGVPPTSNTEAPDQTYAEVPTQNGTFEVDTLPEQTNEKSGAELVKAKSPNQQDQSKVSRAALNNSKVQEYRNTINEIPMFGV